MFEHSSPVCSKKEVQKECAIQFWITDIMTSWTTEEKYSATYCTFWPKSARSTVILEITFKVKRKLYSKYEEYSFVSAVSLINRLLRCFSKQSKI